MQLIFMKILYIVFVTLSLNGCLSKDLIKDPSERIVGGYSITVTETPYHVGIMRRTSQTSFRFYCGGTLINKSTVVTAGHCVVDDNVTLPSSDIRVFAGITILSKLHNYSDVWWVMAHPGYRYEKNKLLWNDVAVIKLLKKVRLTSAVKPIALRNLPVNEGTSCTLSGWGSSYMRGDLSNELKAATIPIQNKQKCSRTYELGTGHPLHDGTICAGRGRMDACLGDSGGPLVCDGMLTGIVSFARGCGEAGYPGVYTEVYKYMDWIKSPRSSNGKAPPPGFYVSRHIILFTILLYLVL